MISMLSPRRNCKVLFQHLAKSSPRRTRTILQITVLLSIFLGFYSKNQPLSTADGPLVIYSDGWYQGSNEVSTPKTFEQMLKLLRWRNCGDLIWQFGASSLLNLSRTNLCRRSLDDCMLQARRNRMKAVIYRPVANLLAETDTFEDRQQIMNQTASSLRKHAVPLLFIGVGTQGLFTRDLKLRDLSPGSGIELDSNDYNLSSAGKSLLRELESLSSPLFLRGAFSVAVARRYGYQRVIESGCPSLMINPNPVVGKRLEEKYDIVKRKLADRSLKIGINIKAHLPILLKLYLELAKEFPNSLFFCQESNDVRMLRESGVPIQRLRTYWSYEDWRKDLCKMELSVGSRIHGNMAALGCPDPVPVFLIAPEYRVLELCEAMQLPHTTIYDSMLYGRVSALTKLISGITFNGSAFDQNRCQKGMQYVNLFDQYGLKPSDTILRISQSCVNR